MHAPALLVPPSSLPGHHQRATLACADPELNPPGDDACQGSNPPGGNAGSAACTLAGQKHRSRPEDDVYWERSFQRAAEGPPATVTKPRSHQYLNDRRSLVRVSQKEKEDYLCGMWHGEV